MAGFLIFKMVATDFSKYWQVQSIGGFSLRQSQIAAGYKLTTLVTL